MARGAAAQQQPGGHRPANTVNSSATPERRHPTFRPDARPTFYIGPERCPLADNDQGGRKHFLTPPTGTTPNSAFPPGTRAPSKLSKNVDSQKPFAIGERHTSGAVASAPPIRLPTRRQTKRSCSKTPWPPPLLVCADRQSVSLSPTVTGGERLPRVLGRDRGASPTAARSQYGKTGVIGW